MSITDLRPLGKGCPDSSELDLEMGMRRRKCPASGGIYGQCGIGVEGDIHAVLSHVEDYLMGLEQGDQLGGIVGDMATPHG
eukprot:12523434-Alexandrium_andersonii.AAC.1